MDLYNFVSLGGLFVFLLMAYGLSMDRKNINWAVVIWGVGIQMLIALVLFVFPVGIKLFVWINRIVIAIMNSYLAGAKFLFGRLAFPPGTSESGQSSLGFFLAFQGLPTIIFFSALMSLLYYYGILPRIIQWFARLFSRLMNISGAESLCAASNIFAGVESALTIKPYLNRMTRSELCTVLTAGMATVASNILAVYTFSLYKYFPMIAGHLVSASLLSAPAAVVMSKMLLPESEKPETLGTDIKSYAEREDNVFSAVINGANNGVRLIVGIAALLIAVLGLVALLDKVLVFTGMRINGLFHLNLRWSLAGLLGYLFYPLTLLLGIPPHDAGIIAPIIGERGIVTELIAYQHLADVLRQNLLQNPRSAVIATYALCGFAHVASMAIFVGGVSALAPQKTGVLGKIAVRSLVAATLACLLTACVAGIFFVRGSILIGS